MTTLAGSDEEENLTLALNLSEPSDDFDQQMAQLSLEGSAPAYHTPHPRTSTSDVDDGLALALRLSLASSDDFDEQVTQLHRTRSAPASEQSRSPTPPNESVRSFNQRESCMPTEYNLASSFTARSLLQDMQGALGDPLVPELSDDAWGFAPHDDYSQVLPANFVEGIDALRTLIQSIPEHDPMKPTLLNHLGKGLTMWFEDLGEIVDVDEAITVQQQAVRLTPDGHTNKPTYLGDLGSSHQSRFEHLGDIADVDEAIVVKQQAVRLRPHGHPDKPAYLNNLGRSLLSRFERVGDIADADEAITVQQQAVYLTPDGHSDKPVCFDNLGNSFRSRFERRGDIADLDEAITAQQLAVHLTLNSHPDKLAFLNNLGISFQRRFERLGDIADLDEAIMAKQQAICLIPDGHPHQPASLNNLGNSFQSRFGRLGDIADLDKAITAHQQAVLLTPDGHPRMPGCLSNLGNSFQSRFERLGDVADLGRAVTAQQQAVHLTPDGHPDKPGHLNSLGVSFRHWFERFGDVADLNNAITAQREAVYLTPNGHPDKLQYLNSLGNSFLCRFKRLSDIPDLSEAITVEQQVVPLTPDNHPNKPGRLNTLGVSFQCRFERFGDIADLDEAITAKQQAAHLTPDNHPDKPMYLNNLGISFQSRFEHLGDIGDLGEAITVKRLAVRLTPDDHPDKPGYLTTLGNSFLDRFKRFGDIADLDEAVMVKQQAVRLTPDGHPSKPGCLNNFGNSLQSRFGHRGDIVDLDEAITANQQAVRLTPDGHPDMPGYLSNLGISFESRFECLGDAADLDEAITVKQQAVGLTPDGHPDKPAHLNTLGQSFYARLSHHYDDTTLAHAICAFSQSAKSSSGRPSDRFRAARAWAILCSSVYSDDTIDAYSVLINLLPRLVWLGRSVEQRYKDIASVGDAVTHAAAVAIHLGKFDLALEWLEQGRSIVWGQMHQLRTPLDQLRQHHPHEAEDLENISHALESAGMTQNSAHSDIAMSQTPEEAARAHRRLADEYDRIVKRIRSFPSFDQFLLPRKSASLCGAAGSGPVVIVNAHTTRCDALILRPHSSQVHHVALPGLQVSAAREMQLHVAGLTRGIDAFRRDYAPYSEEDLVGSWPRGNIKLSDILRQLWLHIVHPILRHLELLQKPPTGELPHITWCLTGPLTFLPVHAAGLYDAPGQPKIFDYVVSSYTPTLTALLSAKRRSAQSSSIPRILAVSQPATPHQQPLPGTVREVNAIHTIQTSIGRLPITRLTDQEATVAAVLQGMKECNWIHLACHGVQDATTATDSAFILVDGRLTLKEIMKQSFSHTELAILSACHTAKGDPKLGEEAIHLAAGMLMAGYRSVVASMWSVRDDDGPILAEHFYKYLIVEAGGDSGRAAYALHDAIAQLRNVRGENNFTSWVPFIHLGICSPLPEPC